MFCYPWCRNVAGQARNRSTHARPGFSEPPPIAFVSFAAEVFSGWAHLSGNVCIRNHIECSLLMLHGCTEVDYPGIAASSHEVSSVAKRLDNICIGVPA